MIQRAYIFKCNEKTTPINSIRTHERRATPGGSSFVYGVGPALLAQPCLVVGFVGGRWPMVQANISFDGTGHGRRVGLRRFNIEKQAGIDNGLGRRGAKRGDTGAILLEIREN